MSPRTHLTSADKIPERGGWLFTVEESDGTLQEVFLVEFDDRCGSEAPAGHSEPDGSEYGIAAWKNYCQHEADQELYRGDIGAVLRDGGIVCPRHGSVFDAATGHCENGPAAGSTLAEVAVTEELGEVYLTDDAVVFSHAGPADTGPADDDDDGVPDSTSHLRF